MEELLHYKVKICHTKKLESNPTAYSNISQM